MNKTKMTPVEKRAIGITTCAALLLLGVGLWRSSLDADPSVNVPLPRMPSPNAFDFYVKAGVMHRALEKATPSAAAVDPVTDPQDWTVLSPQQLAQRYPTAAKESWVRKNGPALQLLRQGFAYQYRSPAARSFVTQLPYLADFRGLARLLIIESHARSERGDWPGACRTTLDILHLGHDLPRGGPLIGGLVGYAIDAMARQELAAITSHLDAATSRGAAVEIEKLEERRVPYSETMQEEMWIYQASLEEMMRNPNWRTNICGQFASSPIDWRTLIRLQACSKRQILNGYTRYMKAVIAQGRLPYILAKPPIPIPNDPLNEMMLSVNDRSRFSAARDEAFNALLEVSLALRAFKLEHHACPATLNELLPDYLKQVPRDPFGGGEALHYRKDGDRCLLYSIGPNGKDDGGKPADDPARANGPGLRMRASIATVRGWGNPYYERHLVQSESRGDMVAGVNH